MPSHPLSIPVSQQRRWALSAVVAAWAFLAASLVSVNTAAGPGAAIDIRAATDGISVEFFATTPRNVLTFNVRVVGPDRFVFERRVENASLQWLPPAELADGYYHWEAWTVSADAGAPQRAMTPTLKARSAGHWYEDQYKQTHLATGSFRVENGLIEVYQSPGGQREGPSLPVQVAGAVLQFLVPGANASTEGSSNNFFGTDAGANNAGAGNSFFGGEAGNQNTTGSSNSFFGRLSGLNNNTGNDNAFFGNEAGVSNTSGSSNAFFGRSAGFKNSTGNSNAFFGTIAGFNNTTGVRNSFFGHDAGEENTEGVNNAFFGEGAGSSNTTENANTFIGTFSDGAAGITSATALGFRAKVTQSNSLVLGSVAGANGSFFNTDVGIGITAPGAPLHVRRFNGTARVLVQEASGTASARELFKLSNNGGPFFIFENTDIAQSYAFAMGATGHFILSHQQTSGVQMRLTPAGNMTIAGSLSEGSSREIKDGITPVDPATVLAKLEALPVSEWSYQDVPGSRHVGPMAEDFHAVFGFGPDEKHIAPRDLAGVALAAAKALKADNDAKDRRITELESRMARLEALLAD